MSISHANAEKSKKILANTKKGEKLTRDRLKSQKNDIEIKITYSTSRSPTPPPPPKKAYNNKQKATIDFTNDLKRNINVEPHHRHWTKKTLSIFSFLFLIAPFAYRFFNSAIISPSESSIKRSINSQIVKYTLDLKDITKIDKIINKYKI